MIRELLASLSIAALFLLLILADPDFVVEEAHLHCPGGIERTFPDMGACEIAMQPGCSCARPPNPWRLAYQWVMPAVIAIAAVALFRSGLALAAALLGFTILASGAATLAVLHAINTIDNVGTVESAVGLIQLTAVSVIIYIALRLARILWTRARRGPADAA